MHYANQHQRGSGERNGIQRRTGVHDACTVATTFSKKSMSWAEATSTSEEIKQVALSIVVSWRHQSVGRLVGQSTAQKHNAQLYKHNSLISIPYILVERCIVK